MGKIILSDIIKKNNTIEYDFFATEDISCFFSIEKNFIIEYPENIESVPNSIAAIPFVCNVLPIVWLTNSVLHLEELDMSFHNCIPNVRGGFEKMFPESCFAGKIVADRLVKCDIPATGGSLAFFSGGLDAVHTLLSHLHEKPSLISIWGADISCENKEGWKIVHDGIGKYAEKYSLEDVVIRSSFRTFDNEALLDKTFSEQLKDGWWHGIKHGIGLLGHAAPYAYLHGISNVYIASSNCPADGPVRCSSNPLTDNHVRYANAKVVHDGFECSRQDKVRNVVNYVEHTGDQVSLHVCWESQTGSNCCKCEKCYRTMMGLIAEGADPVDYGFVYTRSTIQNLQRYLVDHCRSTVVLQKQWTHIQKSAIRNKLALKKHPDWKHVKWILKVDFWHPETLKRPMSIREKLSYYKFYQLLHKMKVKLHG